MTAAALWTDVKSNYNASGLLTLTNIRDRSAVAIDDTVGQSAAQTVLDLWPLYAQVDYDATNAQHVEVAGFGVIAVLWRRGGSSTTIEQVKWEEVFGTDGMLTKVRRTGARGRPGPSSNSGVSQSSELLAGGGRARPWSDRNSLPVGYLPSRRDPNDDFDRP